MAASSILQITLTAPVVGIDATKNARVTRLDQTGASAAAQGVPVSSTPVPLENGIEVMFGGGNYTASDYWLIPARTADGQLQWQPSRGDGSL